MGPCRSSSCFDPLRKSDTLLVATERFCAWFRVWSILRANAWSAQLRLGGMKRIEKGKYTVLQSTLSFITSEKVSVGFEMNMSGDTLLDFAVEN